MNVQYHTPTLATLSRYGLTQKDWEKMLAEQGYKCGACGRVPSTLRLAIDHEHVKDWAKKTKAQRKVYVRGLICWTCNHYRLARGATVANLTGAAEYLLRYEVRRIQESTI